MIQANSNNNPGKPGRQPTNGASENSVSKSNRTRPPNSEEGNRVNPVRKNEFADLGQLSAWLDSQLALLEAKYESFSTKSSRFGYFRNNRPGLDG